MVALPHSFTETKELTFHSDINGINVIIVPYLSTEDRPLLFPFLMIIL